jgi:phosphoserine phosphatase
VQISPGIPELVQLLRAQGKEVFLVSGGFRAIIHPIAEVGARPVHAAKQQSDPADVKHVCHCRCWASP